MDGLQMHWKGFGRKLSSPNEVLSRKFPGVSEEYYE
jgi:hypothetical protein